MSSINHQQLEVTELNQAGMASILVTLIMSVVITLIVIGFAQVATREQSNSLQNQLSTTAYYAAETGVNDAINIIQKNPNDPASDYAKNTCGAPTSATIYSSLYNSNGTTTFSGDNSLSGATYSCLLVNPSPTEIVTTIGSNSQVFPINTGAKVASINLTWQSTQPWNSKDCNSTTDPEFLSDNSWQCELSALRVDLVTVPTGGFTEASLLSGSNSAFILPFNSNNSSCNGSVNFSSNCSNIYGASCSASQGCSVNIVLPNPSASTTYYMRINTIYGQSDTLAISAYTFGSSAPSALNGAEYIIDSTGLTHGVAKRIQVALPILQSTNIPAYAIQTTDDLCKRFYIIPLSAYGSSLDTTPGAPHSATTDFVSGLSDDCAAGY